MSPACLWCQPLKPAPVPHDENQSKQRDLKGAYLDLSCHQRDCVSDSGAPLHDRHVIAAKKLEHTVQPVVRQGVHSSASKDAHHDALWLALFNDVGYIESKRSTMDVCSTLRQGVKKVGRLSATAERELVRNDKKRCFITSDFNTKLTSTAESSDTMLRPTCSQTKTSSHSVPNASVPRNYCSRHISLPK